MTQPLGAATPGTLHIEFTLDGGPIQVTTPDGRVLREPAPINMGNPEDRTNRVAQGVFGNLADKKSC